MDSDREALKLAAAPEPSADVEAPQAEAPPSVNGLFITRAIDEQNNLTTPIQLMGDVKITEVETILKLALKNIKEVLGV